MICLRTCLTEKKILGDERLMIKEIQKHLENRHEVIIKVNDPKEEGVEIQRWLFDNGFKWDTKNKDEKRKFRYPNKIWYYHLRQYGSKVRMLYNDSKFCIAREDSVIYNVSDILDNKINEWFDELMDEL